MEKPLNDKQYSHEDLLSLLSYIYNSKGVNDVHGQVIQCWLNNKHKK